MLLIYLLGQTMLSQLSSRQQGGLIRVHMEEDLEVVPDDPRFVSAMSNL